MQKNVNSSNSQSRTGDHASRTTTLDSSQRHEKSQPSENATLPEYGHVSIANPQTREQTDIQKVRWFLIYVATGLTLLGILAFLLTGDFRLLLGSSLLAYPFLTIIKFYFPKPRE